MLDQYGHVLIFLVLGAAFPLVSLAFSSLVRASSRDPERTTPYECGYVPVGSAYVRFPVRFYFFGLLFILFDVEALYLIPWAVVYREMGMTALLEMGAFLGILVAGLAYVWRRGGLRWGL